MNTNGAKKLSKLIENSNVIIINDLQDFEKHSNLQEFNNTNAVNDKPTPLIINSKFEVFMPKLNCFYNIFDDKEMLSFSGILSNMRPFHEYTSPFIPRVNLFVKYS